MRLDELGDRRRPEHPCVPHANEAAYPEASLQVKTLIESCDRPTSWPWNSHPMLVGVIALCAPVAVAVPAVIGLLTRHVGATAYDWLPALP